MLKASNVDKKECSLRAVNKLYIKQEYVIKDSFVEAIKRHYGGQFEQKDFTKANEVSMVRRFLKNNGNLIHLRRSMRM